MQQDVQTDVTSLNVTSNNVGSCWPTLLRPFPRTLRVRESIVKIYVFFSICIGLLHRRTAGKTVVDVNL